MCLAALASLAHAADDPADKLDRELRARADAPRGHSRVIVRLRPDAVGDAVIHSVRGTAGRRLFSVDGQVAVVPDHLLAALAARPEVESVSLDRPVYGTVERTSATIGADFVHDTLGLDGSGIGVAVIDSGVASWHDDLGSTRVKRFVDFVNFENAPYDDYGHGTHVAGIIAGDGHDSGGRRRGIAPGATLLVEKALDATGQGRISNVIAAIDYAIANKSSFNLRVINLSVNAGVYQSYNTDPLTLAAKRAVEAGLVVVTAAGNFGKGPDGQPRYGGIGAPGNAPWVITVGASSRNGTIDRGDDVMAGFSSRGPSKIDYQAKPDIVAPGVGIESLAEAGSTLYNSKPAMRLWGTVQTATQPYLSLSGTSMASPAVTGTIALMLQANAALTPNLVKAILQFTAESRSGYDSLTQGGGFLNARGAVELAQAMGAGGVHFDTLAAEGDPAPWSGHVIWGNRLVGGDALTAVPADAWKTDSMWGAAGVIAQSELGENVVWGLDCGGDDCQAPEGTGDDGGVDPTVRGTSALDGVEDILWSPQPVVRRERVIVVNEAGLS